MELRFQSRSYAVHASIGPYTLLQTGRKIIRQSRSKVKWNKKRIQRTKNLPALMGDSVTVTIGQQQGRSATAWTKKSDVDLRFAGCLLHGNSFFLVKANCLFPYHLYILNLIHGLMNTIQQPASDVAMTLIIPPEYYQKTSGLRSLSQSLITILNPVIATALFPCLV